MSAGMDTEHGQATRKRVFNLSDAEQSLDIFPSAVNEGKQFEKGNVQNMQNFAQGKFL